MIFWCVFRTTRGFRCRRATRHYHGRRAVVVLALPGRGRPTAHDLATALELAGEMARG